MLHDVDPHHAVSAATLFEPEVPHAYHLGSELRYNTYQHANAQSLLDWQSSIFDLFERGRPLWIENDIYNGNRSVTSSRFCIRYHVRENKHEQKVNLTGWLGNQFRNPFSEYVFSYISMIEQG